VLKRVFGERHGHFWPRTLVFFAHSINFMGLRKPATIKMCFSSRMPFITAPELCGSTASVYGAWFSFEAADRTQIPKRRLSV
jgi:hypothetical protein